VGLFETMCFCYNEKYDPCQWNFEERFRGYMAHKKTRTYELYKMGLYETFCFMILSDKTYIFHIAKGRAQVGTTKWGRQ